MKACAPASVSPLGLLLFCPLFGACGAVNSDPVPVSVATSSAQSGVVFGDVGMMPAGDTTTNTLMTSMPADFTATDRGGWKLGDAIASDATDNTAMSGEARTDGCGSILTGVVRDIQEAHPDFGGDITNLQKGLVADTLGTDGKPVLGPNYKKGFIQSIDSFHQWYNTVPGVNQAFALELYLQPNANKYSFESHSFFPLDGSGFGNEGQNHNFSFTFELHTRFLYKGGEAFQFSGDDDLWVFINGKLAIDLGGVHAASTQNINLDTAAQRLGITPNNEYALDFFQAERHATQSNFQIDTTLQFTNCGITTVR
jgi:fibro-slime domain-containing protein